VIYALLIINVNQTYALIPNVVIAKLITIVPVDTLIAPLVFVKSEEVQVQHVLPTMNVSQMFAQILNA
jgi:hypothetical protein